MSDQLVERIWTDVSERVGDDLRAVTRYDPTNFETKMRDDVRAQYTKTEDQSVVDDTILTQFVVGDTEKSFKVGNLDAVIRVFGDAWILSWSNHLSSKSGIIVSIQRDGEHASMADLEWCLEYLEEKIDPKMN